jgi:prolipoprotein diacylglyceryltransferase
MGAYGAWRFLIEYARDDYRGTTVVEFLTPSQFIALVMIVGAVVLFFIQKSFVRKNLIGSTTLDNGEEHE